ncbi:fimbria/pilus outer membrane usher protein [Kerstersia sp.]|uniref:fimbria/pilus outer membrane usher protein n=1 Tax=Kerstersia sp. TaxID=1930783 RepID=UPI003F8DCC38
MTLGVALALAAFSVQAQPRQDEPVSVASAGPAVLAYDMSLIRGGANVDLSRLGEGKASALPGVYALDIVINGDGVGRFDVPLVLRAGERELLPCLDAELLARVGVAPRYIDALLAHPVAGCLDLAQLDAQAVARVEMAQLRLVLSIPQVYLERQRYGYVDSSYWDYGVNAGFINYQGNVRRDSHHGQSSDSVFLGLSNGVNLGAWRLRNESSVMRMPHQGTQFKSNRTFVQRDVPAWRSQFSAGELYSNSNIFDSVRFQGVQIGSDEGMLADSERGYAPVVRGVAESNATVEIRQNGYMLYRTDVPPGPFMLTEIYPSGSNGDLEVTVIEADGRRRVYIQPFSSLPLMVRQGYLRYSVEAGRYKANQSQLDTPGFLSLSGTYGWTENISLSGGMQVAEGFKAINAGLGGNTPIGALSVDVTQSFSRVQGQTRTGQSIRGLYSRTLASTSTTVTLAAYRYSTSGYRSFDSHVQDLSRFRYGPSDRLTSGRSRSRFDLSITQELGEDRRYGDLFLTAQRQSFWDGQTTRSYSAGYGNTFRGMSYNLSISRAKEFYDFGGGDNETRVMLTLSMPLGSSIQPARMAASYDHTRDGGNMSATVYGDVQAGGQNVSLSAQAARSRNGDVSGSAGASTELPMVALGASFGAGKHYHSASMNARGAVVVHGGGVNFSRTAGDGFALVQVEGVPGVGVGNGLARTAANGYAVYPTTQPYRFNTIRLDSGELGADVELDSLSRTVVPHRGAIVKAEFKGVIGRRVQLRILDAAGEPLPLGAEVLNAEGRSLGWVDHRGQALVLVTQDEGRLQAQWGDGRSCQLDYVLPARDPVRNYDKQGVICQ